MKKLIISIVVIACDTTLVIFVGQRMSQIKHRSSTDLCTHTKGTYSGFTLKSSVIRS